jgi:hypothetical protein
VNKQDKNSELSHLVSVSQKSKPHRWCNGWRVRTSSVADRGFDPMLGQTKDYDIGICCFSAKHTALRSKNKDWMARNQDNVSEWSDMSTRELFQWASSIKIQLSVLVWNKADFIIISLKINLFTPWYSWTITHSLTHKRFCGVSIIWYVCIYFKMLLISINNLSGSDQYKVFLFVDTNVRGFYKIHWSIGSWIPWFQALQAINSQWENCISLDFNFRSLSEPRNPWKLEPDD